MSNRGKFQFSNKTAQNAEAKRNAVEALAHLERWVKPTASVAPPPGETTEAGQCFRRVSAILAGKERKR